MNYDDDYEEDEIYFGFEFENGKFYYLKDV